MLNCAQTLTIIEKPNKLMQFLWTTVHGLKSYGNCKILLNGARGPHPFTRQSIMSAITQSKLNEREVNERKLNEKHQIYSWILS